jgi:hypothetical protein
MVQRAQGQETKGKAEPLPSIESVVAGMNRNFDPVRHNLRIQYRRDNKSFTPEQKTSWPWVEIDYAIKGPKRYLKHTKPQKDGAHEVKSTDLWVYDGQIFRALNTRTASGWMQRTRNGHIDYDLYCYQTFIGGILEYEFPEIRHIKSFFWLPESLKNGRYQVKGWEQQDGQRCLLIEDPGLDKIWVDPARGYNVVRRELREGIGDPLHLVAQMSEFHKIGPQTWLPFRVVWQLYGERDRPAVAGKVVEERDITVADATLDPQPDSLFVLVYPTGSTVIDGEREVAFKTVAPNENPFDAGVGQAIAENPPVRGRSSRILPLIILNIIVIGALLVVYLKLKKRRRPKSPDVV